MTDLRPSVARRGFTLIELLVVIAIIVTLLGLLIPAIAVLMQKGPITRTVSLHQKVEAAIQMYYDQHFDYPQVPIGDYDKPTEVDGIEVEDVHATLVMDEFHRNNRILTDAVRDMTPDVFGPGTETIKGGLLVDAWDQPLFYRPYLQYTYDDGRDDHLPPPREKDADPHGPNPPRPDSYQLWSFGPNRINENGATHGDSDDIANWHSH